ncbi:MAG TPA: hybrid sensor histidine kinase/response regulator, partial [Leptospiraceae bacterium]|nr:hybrid sensor histidine kinase/response regulator [Leptospiraceae bacterium]
MTDRIFRILIVDDNKNNIETLFALLDEKGYKIITSRSGENALKILEKTLPDLILLDILMPPGMDGIETCRKIKENPATEDVPVIFMTALTDTVDKVKGFEVGAVDYITKPFQTEEILARIKTHLSIQKLKTDLKASLEKEKTLNMQKSKFMSMILHDLRTPLAVIQSTSDLLFLKGDAIDAEKREKYHGSIDRSISKMTEMMDSFLIMTKAESGKFDFHPEFCDMEKLCIETADSFREIGRDTHSISLNFLGNDFIINADPKLIQNTIANLLSNAIKYSPRGGNIDFEVKADSSGIQFKVKDSGIGIPNEETGNLF